MTPERIQKIIDDLRGTAQSLPNVLDVDEDENDRLLHEEIDAQLFECETCGWWCSIDEMSDKEFVCDECYDEMSDKEFVCDECYDEKEE